MSEVVESEFVPIEELSDTTMTQDSSFVDLIRQDLKELSESTEVHIRVEGYGNSGLTIRYHLPESGKELDLLSKQIERQTKDKYQRGVLTAIDTIIHLHDGLFVQPPEVNEPVLLDPQDSGTPARFDEPRLAEILGMENPETCGSRAVVRRLFNDNELMVISHAEKLNRWLMNTKADLDVEFWQLGGQ